MPAAVPRAISSVICRAGPSTIRRAASSSSAPVPSSSSSHGALPSLASLPSILPHTLIPRHKDFPNKYGSPQHASINHPARLFDVPPPEERPATLGGNVAERKEAILSAVTRLSKGEIKGLHKFTVRVNKVTQMTKKGKIPSYTALVVVGSPSRGLVGIGWGRAATNVGAMDSGFQKAVISMDYVNKYEGRTLWGQGQDLISKWGACKVILRARPAGFGLMVPPGIHRVLTACGIRDASATIENSRNPVEVIKAVIQILHGGANPPGLGSGVGTRARREDKGSGMRSKEEIERERGRYGVDVGRRV